MNQSNPKFRNRAQQMIYVVINPFVKFLIKLGLTPNAVTFIGLLLNILVTAIFIEGAEKGHRGELSYVGWAGAMVLFAGLFDMLDGDDWVKDCWVWLYKGAWQEWDIAEIEMAIPMSPDQVKKKRFGIFIHQSQKDMVPFQGSDNREFWQRAEDRNANTANLYAALGMTKYAAMEAFVRWHY